jgi:2-hydroxychromene-2-carboxylate isomerase
MEAATKLQFYFDYLSPYAYLAWHRLPAFAETHGLSIEPVPVALAALLNHHGQKGPAEFPAKRIYAFKDCIRRAAVLGVSLAPPHELPFPPLMPLRVTHLDMTNAQRMALIDQLFAAAWAEGRDMRDEALMASICERVGVPDALQRIAEPSLKQRLIEAGRDAIDRGVFGVPTMIVGDELFWGEDSFEPMARHLRGEDPVDCIEAWMAVPVGVRR